MKKKILIVSDILGYTINTDSFSFFKGAEVLCLSAPKIAKIPVDTLPKDQVHTLFLK